MEAARSTGEPRLIAGRDVAYLVEQRALALVHAHPYIHPSLALVHVGDHPDAASYRRIIEKSASRVGVTLHSVALPSDASIAILHQTLQRLQEDPSVHGILVQNPLSFEQRCLVSERLASHKDVEGLTAINLGRLALDQPTILPCTPAAIVALIESRIPDLKAKRVVIVNRSATIGRPLAQILLSKRATVTVCSSATVDLPAETRRAEILIVAIGKPRAVGAEYIGEGALVIDVGINVDPQGSGMCGDVDTEAVLERVSAITPVPGGVGPVTTAFLMSNTVTLACAGNAL